jgi:hypothetical protein
MKTGKKTFLAKERGFQFPNRFDVSDLLDWPLFTKWTQKRPIIYGLCGGMCFAALDLYSENKPIPEATTPPADETPLYQYLRTRQKDSLSLATLLKVFLWTWAGDVALARWTAKNEIPRIRASLDEGKPVVLALIRVRRRTPTSNHQVLAIDYLFDETTNQLELTLYDPNHPGQEPKILVDLHHPDQGIQPRQSTGEDLRGFFVIGYQRKTPPWK